MFYRITEGIRITVRPDYERQQSDPSEPRHVFVYHIRIENVGDQPAQLLWRHWDIHDSALAEDTQVEGEGVVGEKPLLEPGGVHEYESFCVLRGTRGWMEGWYEFVRPDGSKFRADVPRFSLLARAADYESGGPRH
ncbi:MAG: Co2+/Mg2+ efflux protein ApaG [Gemmatimonadetes bacterium]|nr:Co2+/Mg2+ efflux protein ApaG [Gemmatimonadota bacterium]